MPPIHRVCRIFHKREPRPWEGIEVSNAIFFKAIVDAWEQRDHKMLPGDLAALVGKVFPNVLPNTEEVSAVAESASGGRKEEKK